jgi:fermentation-respiration switch protein FrsA (DUF1100 family)
MLEPQLAVRAKNWRGTIWWAGIALVVGPVIVLATALAWLKFHEDELVFKTALSHRQMLAVLPASAARMTIPMPGTTGLAALAVRAAPAQDRGYWILHLHGNADSAFSAGQVHHCEVLSSLGFNVLAFDYRGFGLTPGRASEASIAEDGEAAYQALVQRGVSPDRIILWGHSLGSGPATLLASRHTAAALVLFGAFTSIPDAAADTYPHLPVRWLVSIQFNSLRRIRDVHVPVLIAHSADDRLVPYRHALALYAAANPPKRLISLKPPFTDGLGGHVDALYEHPDMLQESLRSLLHSPDSAEPGVMLSTPRNQAPGR